MTMRTAVRTLAAVAAGVLLAAVPAGVASAHVEISPAKAAAGSSPRVEFEVPNEISSAATTRVEVYLPDSPAVPAARPVAVAGWRAQVLTAPLTTPLEYRGTSYPTRVTRIVWTATGGGIKGSARARFPVVLGPLPGGATLVLKTLQTYSNGQVVRWIDEPTTGPEPEHPAPVLVVAAGAGPVPAAPATSAPAQSPAPVASDPAPPSPTPAAAPADDSGGTVLLLVVAVLALAAVTATAVLLRRRART
jgi:uncharacterized protein YcnI